jgi:hypothetical protein
MDLIERYQLTPTRDFSGGHRIQVLYADLPQGQPIPLGFRHTMTGKQAKAEKLTVYRSAKLGGTPRSRFVVCALNLAPR